MKNPPPVNISARRVGGLRFLKLGRLQVSFCVTRDARPIGAGERQAKARRYTERQLDRAFMQGMRAAQMGAR